ncbi:MAG: ECF-type sigma factor [Gammaproteobacteria bacterium]
MPDQPAITRLLGDWRNGDQAAFETLSNVVYDELRRIARRLMAAERAGHTLQPTALVNEAYLELLDASANVQDRQHFFALAARVMRRTLVDHARGKGRIKRGGDQIAVTLQTSIGSEQDFTNVLELDHALTQLAEHDPKLAQAVELIYFGGLTYVQAAEELNISRTALVEDLKFAKTWLRRAMT